MSEVALSLEKKYERTTEGLRDMLFDEVDLLRAGKIDSARARATANIARQIIESVRVQVQFQRVVNETNSFNLVESREKQRLPEVS